MRKSLLLTACAVGLLGLSLHASAKTLPDPASDPSVQGQQTVVLAGGCFWGMQDVFQHVKGVTGTTVGYAGGDAATAHYETVSTGTTGHAESLKITYDPAQVSFGQLLKVYFSVAADPTELNRQGPDEGTQYRTEIFTTTPEQAATAYAYISQLNAVHVFDRPIVTTVETLPAFYPAESYHQNYATKHPDNPYIAINDAPKVSALQREFPSEYKD